MKELKFIQACPSDIYYTWQVNLWMESLKEIGHSDKAINLIFTPKGRENRDKWKQIEDLYPEAEFHFYEDEDNLSVPHNQMGLFEDFEPLPQFERLTEDLI